MGSMLGWLIRNPTRGAILSGIIIALVLGWASFPSESRTEKTLSDWLPVNAATGEAAADLQAAAMAAGEEAVRVSEAEFRELGLPLATAFATVNKDERGFSIRYAGRDTAGSGTLYIAEREVSNGTWWSPERWAYRALEAEVNEFGTILRLTFERDLTGLIALLLMNVVIGGIYGAVIGMILSVLGMEGLDRRHTPRQLPAPNPAIPITPRGTFRA